ncbi:hypothetical protein DL93DRAFT_1004190 [Clavulina sp. PMI_390]|nr:hypothetical protein DL93DRAFT_1004190 [Clavulina sp. PMI_390]
MSTEITPISYPDGDIILLSSDEIEHKVHSFILREASGFFRDMFELGKPDPKSAPVVLAESTEIINFILSHLYPRSSPPLAPPNHAIFNAVEKYRLECYTVAATLASYLESQPHPLRAWALAVRFGYPEARKAAMRRYIRGSDDYLSSADSSIPEELEYVTGGAVFRAVAIRKETIEAASKVMRSIPDKYRCTNSRCSGWGPDLHKAMGSLSLFGSPSVSILSLKTIALQRCQNCGHYVEFSKVQVDLAEISSLLVEGIEKEAGF